MKIALSRMEKLAVTGAAYRFRREMDDALGRRNADILSVMQEHGFNQVPDTFVMRMNDDGYIYAIEWGPDIETEEEHDHA